MRAIDRRPRCGPRGAVAGLGAATILLGLAGAGAPASAQEGCEAVAPGNVTVVARTLPGVGQVTYISEPHFLCAGGVEIWADSAVAYPDRAMSHLIGSVRYRESTREMRADEARYFTSQGRLQAEGSVSIIDEGEGSSIRNGDLVYLLRTDFRDTEEMTVTTGADGMRPVAVLTPPPPDSVPTEVAADSMVADSLQAEAAFDTIVADTVAADSVPAGATPVSIAADSVAAEIALDSSVPDSLPSALAPDSVPSDSMPPSDSVPFGARGSLGAIPEAPADSATPPKPPTPYRVVADRIFLLGSGYFAASGTVEIERDSLLAYADSTEYDQASGSLLLEGGARVDGDAYELTGRRITMAQPNAAAREIHALREARLVGDGLLLTSARIALFLRDDALERLVATPIVRPPDVSTDSTDTRRPEATVEGFVLTADSVEVRAPDEQVERVFAAGRARSVSTSSDSLNVERLPDVARTDWLEGDTVIITFAPPSAEPAANPGSGAPDGERPALDVEEIIARVGARSLYRLPPSDSLAKAGVDPPAVHYVIGDEIRIVMAAGEVEAMHVVGQTRGVHLEPLRRVPADSTAADTTGVDPSAPLFAVDTAAVDTTVVDTTAVDTTGIASDPPAASAETAPDDTIAGARPGRRGSAHEESNSEGDTERSRTQEVPWIRP